MLKNLHHVNPNIGALFSHALVSDAIRDVRRFQEAATEEVDLRNNPTAETNINMKMFRAQRNLYIAGGALFLLL